MSAITPGEIWEAKGMNVYRGKDCIGIFDTDNATIDIMEERARVAAAAPDLLAALQDVVAANEASTKIALADMPLEKRERMMDDNETHTIRAFIKALAAIAKATATPPAPGDDIPERMVF